jgi:hypothetical protein
MSTGFNPYYQGSSGITAKISGGRLIDSPTIGDLTAGASYYFDGTDDKVQVADADALSIIEQGTDGSWAVEVFFRADDGAASSDRLVSKGTAEYSFGLADCSIDGSTITYPTAMDNSSYADQWMHLMLVCDDNTGLMEQFINGVSQGTTDCTATNVTGSAALRFGLETDDSGDFNGEIGRVRLFNDALTDDEVRILYNGGAVPQDRQDELVGEWLSSGVTAGAWIESSGNDFTGEVTGATAINEKANILRTDQNLVADLQSGASFQFDGTDDTVGLVTSTSLTSSDGSFAIEVLFTPNSVTTNQTLFAPSPADGERRAIGINTNGNLVANIGRDGSGSYHGLVGSQTLVVGKSYHVMAVFEGTADFVGAMSIYINGVLDNSGSLVSNNATNPYVYSTDAKISMGHSGYTGDSRWFSGSISKATVHNRALSAAEVRAAYNGQAVSFEYVGAKQDELVTNGTMESGSPPSNWSASSLTLTQESAGANVYAGSYSAKLVSLAGNQWIQQAFSGLEANKKYRVSAYMKGGSGGEVVSFMHSGLTGSSGVDDAQNTLTTSFALYEAEFTTGTDVSGSFLILCNSAMTAYVDNVSVVQIGCVAEYLPSGINATQWVDTSGNNLHGTTSTATAVNHEVGAITATGVVEVNNGIKFPATAVASADANTLDDYEEGTWAAAFSADGGTAVIKPTMKIGSYTKVGRVCHIGGFFEFDASTSSPTGEMSITGLPFVCKSTGLTDLESRSAVTIFIRDLASAATGSPVGFIANGGARIYIQASGLTTDGADLAPLFDSGSSVWVNGSYIVEE